MNRKQFITKSVLGLSGISLLGGIYAWQIEPYWLEFVKVPMKLPNLPPHWKGKTLMQISDLHVGNRVNQDYLIESLQKAQEYQPDIVVYTGDFVHYEDAEQITQLEEVMQYAVQGKIATLGVLGNHDYGKNWSEVAVAEDILGVLNSAGIHILRNEMIEFQGLFIFGIDDYWSPMFDGKKAMKSFIEGSPAITLCHNPDVCDLDDVWNTYTGWILSGHTHGGQVKPPFLNPPVLPVKNKRYAAGVYDLNEGRTLYINRALGFLHQIRLNCRPEITVFSLS